jgi:Calcineurin-like phosphoesterase
MVIFSKDPDIAEQQMNAVIVYLTTFGYIDGDFSLDEKLFVLEYIRSLVEMRVAETGLPQIDPMTAMELVNKFTSHFDEVFEQVDNEIRNLFTEVVGDGEKLHQFVYAKLKLRCFEIFKAFDQQNQQNLLAVVDKLITKDGQEHPNEKKFREELWALLNAEEVVIDIPMEELDLPSPHPPLRIGPPGSEPAKMENHPILELMEQHYSADREEIRKQAAGDLELIQQTMVGWDEQRATGRGRLAGKHNVGELAGAGEFLDDHVYVIQPPPGRDYELTVLGDLHGCYSCLKGALLQADFFRKVQAWRKEPAATPMPKLVLLGDYIDRGLFSYNGILRTIMQLFASMPEHVHVLRGNHEYYVELDGRIYGGVRPAEAISTMIGYLPDELFSAWLRLFEAMPNTLLFDRTLFVHAGIPRDETLVSHFRDLSSLNDPTIRFEMMWSDPSSANYVPVELQRENARFPFGRHQFRAFMNRIGCNTLVRGHEKIDEGWKRVYDDGEQLLINLFSAGGRDNADLPANSSYRAVTPMAMTILYQSGQTTATPWEIDYRTYQDPTRNAFYREPPEIAFKAE